jgi:hypothetical protein
MKANEAGSMATVDKAELVKRLREPRDRANTSLTETLPQYGQHPHAASTTRSTVSASRGR